MKIPVYRSKNFPVRRLKLHLFIDNEHVGTMGTYEKQKDIVTNGNKLQIKSRQWNSNVIALGKFEEESSIVTVSTCLSDFIYHLAYFNFFIAGTLLISYSFFEAFQKDWVFWMALVFLLPMVYVLVKQYGKKRCYLSILEE